MNLPNYLCIFVVVRWKCNHYKTIYLFAGFIIANHLQEWTTKLDRIRLSQIIEMYYSSYGVPMNHGIRACNRKQNMAKLFPASDIYEQTLNMVNVLWIRLSPVYITPSEIQNISNAAVKAFENYWRKFVII